MPRKILIADDNPAIRRVLSSLVEAEEDFDLCGQATNGQEAIELALQHHPELVILDLSMPVLNGLDAARKLKKLMPLVPIILFTEHSVDENPLWRARLPVDCIVQKSDAPELMSHIRSLLPPTPAVTIASA